MDEEIEAILAATRVPQRNGHVYCIGPYARRVSFSSQQNRALNLVWALKQDDQLRKGMRIAVVGGGIAGLTAALAFGFEQCTVHVFEQSQQKLSLQRHTEHRFVSPTINQWPHVEPSITTRLPFLEWYAGSCAQVVRVIEKQFDAAAGRNVAVFDNVRVSEIREPVDGRVRLDLEPVVSLARVPEEIDYDLAVIAIGFGEESNTTTLPHTSYWLADALEQHRARHVQDEHLVSGCGDGGLIDALRIVHQRFDKGELALRVATLLWDTELAETIRKAEKVARVRPDGLQHLATTYVEAARIIDTDNHYDAVRTLLDDSLGKVGARAWLMDNGLAAPYSFNAAPIHKLLVAHAMRHHRLRFQQGTITVQDGMARINGTHTIKPPDSRVVIRHGASAAFDKLLTKAEVNSLETNQRPYAELMTTPYWCSEHYPRARRAMDGWPKYDRSDGQFIADRRELAEEAINALYPGSALNVSARRTYLEVTLRREMQLPLQELFGIKVEYGGIASRGLL